MTFLLTDLVESSDLWEAATAEMAAAVARHEDLVADAVGTHGGYVVKRRGEGDSTFSTFEKAADAVAAAVALVEAMEAEPWPTPRPLQARVAIHTGEAEHRDGDWFGPSVNRAARLRSVGHGRQVLLSHATAEAARHDLPVDVSLDDLGPHRLRNVATVERIYVVRHPELPSTFPPLRSLGSRPPTLPAERTSFVGRESEVEAVRSSLREHRVVTILGPGGTGKTRLAIRVAEDEAADADDVWWVDLAPLGDEASVADAVAMTLGAVGERAEEAVASRIGDARALLVLDNCEHVVERAAEVTALLLQRCPRLRVLGTTRERLRLRGEDVLPLGPLPTSDARALFADRATAADPAFSLTASNVGVVDGICERLDGLPLAVELAAAQLRLLSTAEVAARLDARLALLPGERDRAERHRTLAAVVDWSWSRLDDRQRLLLARIAVFASPVDIATIEAVCADDRLPASGILEVLAALVDRSLVVAVDGDGPRRFRLLDTIRAFAGGRLADVDDPDGVRRRHARWFSRLSSGERPDDRDAALADVEAALRWALDEGEHDLVVALGWTLAAIAHLRGLLGLRALLERAVEVTSGGGERVELLHAVGTALSLTDLGAALRILREAGALCDERVTPQRRVALLSRIVEVTGRLGLVDEREEALEDLLAAADPNDTLAMSTVRGQLGWMRISRGDIAGARELAEQAVADARRTGDLDSIGTALNLLGAAAALGGDHRVALAALEEVAECGRRIGRPELVEAALINTSQVAEARGELDVVLRCCDELLEVATALDDVDGRVFGEIYAAAALAGMDRSAEGVDRATNALRLAREAGARQLELMILPIVAQVLLDAGQVTEAEDAALQAMTLAGELRDDLQLASARVALAHVRLIQGDAAAASALVADALTSQPELLAGGASVLMATAAMQLDDVAGAATHLGRACDAHLAADAPPAAHHCLATAAALATTVGDHDVASVLRDAAVTAAAIGRGDVDGADDGVIRTALEQLRGWLDRPSLGATGAESV